MFVEVFELEPHIFKGDSCAAPNSNKKNEKKEGRLMGERERISDGGACIHEIENDSEVSSWSRVNLPPMCRARRAI